MRLLTFLLLTACLSACVSRKKVDAAAAAYGRQLDSLGRVEYVLRDTVRNLRLSLERQRGVNDGLLMTQDRLQDRLAVQEDELDELRGNLTSTNFQMENQVQELKKEVRAVNAYRDSILDYQQRTVLDFQERTARLSDLMYDSLETRLPTTNYFVTNRDGQVILSIQEESLFKPRSVETLAPAAAPLLSTIAAVLESDPLIKVLVVGHTDNTPNPRRNTDNWEYAALRATHLADVLASEHFVSPNRITAASGGEFSPARSNATEEGRRNNRRIDFVFTNNVGNLLRGLNKLIPKEN